MFSATIVCPQTTNDEIRISKSCSVARNGGYAGWQRKIAMQAGKGKTEERRPMRTDKETSSSGSGKPTL
jgi:hypothetical protein